jgi:hypothetical protein
MKSDVVNRLKAETKMLKLEVAALQSRVEMPQEAAPTILPAGEPCFLPLTRANVSNSFVPLNSRIKLRNSRSMEMTWLCRNQASFHGLVANSLFA